MGWTVDNLGGVKVWRRRRMRFVTVDVESISISDSEATEHKSVQTHKQGLKFSVCFRPSRQDSKRVGSPPPRCFDVVVVEMFRLKDEVWKKLTRFEIFKCGV